MKKQIYAAIIALSFFTTQAQTWKPFYDYDRSLYGFEDEEGNRKDVKYKNAEFIDEKNPIYSIVESKPKGDDYNGEFGIIDTKTMKFIFPLQYKNITINGGIVSLETKIDEYKSSIELFDKSLNPIYKGKLESFNIEIKNGYIGLKNETGKYGVIDSIGEVIIPFNYEDIKILNDGYFAVSSEGYTKYAIADKTNKIIIPENIVRYNSFEDGFFITETKINDKEHYLILDKTGKEIFKILKDNDTWLKFSFYNKSSGCTFFDIETRNAQGKNVSGLYDSKGTLIVPIEYYSCTPLSCNMIRVSKKNGEDIKYGAYDVLTKKMIVPANFISIDLEKAENKLKAYKDTNYKTFDMYDLKGNIVK